MSNRLPKELAFYATHEHECSYLSQRKSITLFADPTASMTNGIYSSLADLGFRRSGAHVYRPACSLCRDCVPIRIPVNLFTSRRNQRRVLKRNQDLSVSISLPDRDQEHFDLYLKYQRTRHTGGGMDNDDQDHYLSFLNSEWSDTRLVDFRLDGKLISVAVVDFMDDGLSAVYTYFDPDYANRSLGTLAVLWEIQWAAIMNMEWLYLGYWIQDSEKMNYKTTYLPFDLFLDGEWQRFEKDLMQATRSEKNS